MSVAHIACANSNDNRRIQLECGMFVYGDGGCVSWIDVELCNTTPFYKETFTNTVLFETGEYILPDTMIRHFPLLVLMLY